MPRNRQQIPREERAGDLLAAATELFLSKGYAKTTMADISAAAGVARGNVYWYFDSKDDIFAAVMDRMLSREIRTLSAEQAGTDPLSRLVRGLADMRYSRPLHQAMHDRLPHSEAVRAAHNTFLGWIVGMVDEVIAEHGLDGDPDIDAALLRDTVVAVFEGANVPNDRNRPAHEMIRLLMDSVLAGHSPVKKA
ncbi:MULTISPECIES: TetR/AcrR family transcriptional regulator [unclassified Streptomyces]|uniref:TetR/AcrR family transcriptional regulator n=1 Tax=unclassified Streptomyces TaxID=2593676 RepID=UPI0022572E56|nr:MULTISPECIES: TetR/AcrR family transcriptional regulator [unclassified Streptomyces]MCX5336063.1 TetR/AcrR family transcriptional regulator [Streptomyces sp. NBC_00140]MCX5366784.1 TetR/AcrR family transcriptional regulator [Streptomyces sp. NBC_00124]